MRRYPVIDVSPPRALTPISFVVVHFCDDYHHNILKSEAVQGTRNQLVRVDNRWGYRFDTLSAAINFGLDQAVHDLVAVVHEDVLLPDGWQHRFQHSLDALEAEDPGWGLLGSVGWDAGQRMVGHWSDPHQYTDTLQGRPFAEVARLDEQLLVIRKSRGFRFDDLLPSIHNIGRDASSTLARAGRRTYALDAPTIHKYADQRGQVIGTAQDSDKIRTRFLPANRAEWHCSNTYLVRKWPEWASECRPPPEDLGDTAALDRVGPPVIALARGGSGSRLLSALLQDLGLWFGPEITPAGDTRGMIDAIYRAVLSRHQRRADWQRAEIVPRLRAAAATLVRESPDATAWGFKLPESLLIVPQLDQAFPGARYVHMIRDPLSTCLRRTHMTARFDNAIGRTAIRAAYAHCGLPPEQSLDDSPALRMAHTTRHQIETARAHAARHLSGRWLELRFEDLLADPAATRARVGAWLGLEQTGDRLGADIDPDRARSPKVTYPPEVARATAEALDPLRRALGYR